MSSSQTERKLNLVERIISFLTHLLRIVLTLISDFYQEFKQDWKVPDLHGNEVLGGVFRMQPYQIAKLKHHKKSTCFGLDYGAPEERMTLTTLIAGAQGSGKTKLMETFNHQQIEDFHNNPNKSMIISDPKAENLSYVARCVNIHPNSPDFPFIIGNPFDRRSRQHILSDDITGIYSLPLIGEILIPPPYDTFFKGAASTICNVNGVITHLAKDKGLLKEYTLATWLRMNRHILSASYQETERLINAVGLSRKNGKAILDFKVENERSRQLLLEIAKTQTTFLQRFEMIAAVAENLREKTGRPGYSINSIIDSGQGLIMGSDYMCPDEMTRMGSIQFTFANAKLLSLPDDPERRIYMLFDEGIDMIPHIPNLMPTIRVSRGKGGCMLFTALSTPGLYVAFGERERAEEFLSMVNNFFLGGMGKASADTFINQVIPYYTALVETISTSSGTLNLKTEALPVITADELANYPPANSKNGSKWLVYLRGRSCHEYQLTPHELKRQLPPTAKELFGEEIVGYDRLSSAEVNQFSKLRDWTPAEKQSLGIEQEED